MASLALLVAGCVAPSQESTHSGAVAVPERAQQIVTREDMIAEYQRAVGEYSLPPHYSYPPSSTIGESGANYEVGWGSLQAVDYWNCAWGKEWLEYRTSDKRRGGKAFGVYTSVTETEVFRTAWDRVSVQEPFKEGVEAAQLGDPSALQQDISVNCGDVKKDA